MIREREGESLFIELVGLASLKFRRSILSGALQIQIQNLKRDGIQKTATAINSDGGSRGPVWKRRVVQRWTELWPGRASDGTESYSKKYNDHWRIIKLAVDCNGE
jgi:hypothetical protein